MIYFDNSATSLMKPPQVAEAVKYAINNLGNSGRSFYTPVLDANRTIFQTRMEIAKLIGLEEALNVAFTSSATESLNLVINSLIEKEDSVITTVLEHNSVLRPLYLKGCQIDFLDCDENGNLHIDSFTSLVKPTTKYFICIHGSNAIGNIVDAEKLYTLCKEQGIIMILDISQTFGSFPVNTKMADIFCFTGHKGLFGPQGTGGIITNGEFDFRISKTGGAGVNSFDRFQATIMPEVFEAGTTNAHSLAGLQKGVEFVNEIGIENIHAREMQLLKMFYNGIKNLVGLKFYGDFSTNNRLAIVALNAEGVTASDFAFRLWEEYGIATRPGSHCAPLLHKHFQTVEEGMVRFSFSYFNTEEEIEVGIRAVKGIVNSLG
ncbi:MAG TPA: aminotransferase class V-fold PLP-dependent enzyme [Syntrophomonadaceae bacterium]|nr:aminotransferase class V-fold PLP-dependent enzyme [Syntrophomonadaceae bacterium]